MLHLNLTFMLCFTSPQVFKNHSTPSVETPSDEQSNIRKKKRKFLSEAAAKPIVINLQRVSPTPNQSSPRNRRRNSPSNSGSQLRKDSKEREGSKSPLRNSDKSEKGLSRSKSPGVGSVGSRHSDPESDIARPLPRPVSPSAKQVTVNHSAKDSAKHRKGRGEGDQVSKNPRIRSPLLAQVRFYLLFSRLLPAFIISSITNIR